MNQILKRLPAGLMGLSLFAAASLHANPVTVTETGVGPNETAWINSDGIDGLGDNLHVYACVVDLLVNGTATTGFCIDPWHWSASGPQSYNTEPLASGPKLASGMGAAAALKIEELWQQYYSTPSISNITAAALQIEIWKIVDAGIPGSSFTLDSVDGGDSAAVYAKLAEMETFLGSATSSTPYASTLIAVTGASGQDYVISVPDGGTTVALLGAAFIGLIACRKKLRAV